MAEFVQVNPATATTGALVAVDFITLGTATDVAIQRVKVGFGTDTGYADTATNAPFPVVLETTRLAVDSAAGATDHGLVFLAVRDDALAELVATDADYVPLRTSSDGMLWTKIGTMTATGTVNIAAATGSISVIQPTATNLNVYAATTSVLNIQQMSTATSPVSVGTWTATGIVMIDTHSTATLPVSLAILPTTATLPVTVATTPVFNIQQMSTATSPVSVGTWTATGTVFIDNKATATVFVAVQNTATVNVANTATVNVTNTATVSLLYSATRAVPVHGFWAHDATSTGNPVVVGGIARTTVPTGVAAGDVAQIMADPHGRVINMPFSDRASIFKAYITATATTVATLATGAGTAGVFRDLVSFVAFNNATEEARVRVRSSSTATEFFLNLAPDGGGIMFSPPRPWTQAIAATSWDVTLTTALTSTDALTIGAMFMETT